MTKAELIEAMKDMPDDAYIVFDVDIEAPILQKNSAMAQLRNGIISLPIEYVEYDNKRDRIVMMDY